MFGLIHLSQGNEIGEWIGIFLVTFCGGILFAWLYAEWNYNVWVPIFAHMFMNLAFVLFSAGENALGGVYLNVFRTMAVILLIGLTILYKKRENQPLEVNKHTLWMKKE